MAAILLAIEQRPEKIQTLSGIRTHEPCYALTRNKANMRVCMANRGIRQFRIRDTNTVKSPFFVYVEYFFYFTAEVYLVYKRFQRLFTYCFPRAFYSNSYKRCFAILSWKIWKCIESNRQLGKQKHFFLLVVTIGG